MARNEINRGISPQDVVNGLGVYGKSYGDAVDVRASVGQINQREFSHTKGIILNSREAMKKDPTALLGAAHLLDDARVMLEERGFTPGIFPTEEGFREKLSDALDIHLLMTMLGKAFTHKENPDNMVTPQEMRVMMLSTGITGKHMQVSEIAEVEGMPEAMAEKMIGRSKKVLLNSVIDLEIAELEAKARED